MNHKDEPQEPEEERRFHNFTIDIGGVPMTVARKALTGMMADEIIKFAPPGATVTTVHRFYCTPKGYALEVWIHW